ncbi:STAS/SEC14 domain-containing protein [Aquimarina mytili]|uniref:STAS/SEC14 domain-containing protein n=1 Tax=Aquimarina mytili TaxID=874423 RepID=A0A936ZUI4_9FLAO|nr:STAS/SEC14 domain-containing protein [Aquimarina mytili]MBL0685829.1 STAS/SEC14 domain-containing protein [Aquimarina mytili]
MLRPINEGEFVKKYDLEIGKVSFYKNYLIIEVAEGISFNHEKAKQLSRLTELHFGNQPFGYISNRINSYSLEPMDYLKIKEILPNIKAFAVVAYNNFQKASVRIENMFYQDGIVTFEQIEEAVKWIKDKLK